MSIKVSNVTKLYGAQKALQDVSFSVEPGEIVGFLGPNGAGKSTMMKIITCFLPPNNGEVSVCDISVHEDDLNIKKKLGYLPEHNPLYLEMYVAEYLEFVGGLFEIGDLEKRIEEVIELVGLQHERHKKIGALSKGYRQRVGLAQAFIHDPEVLILDEPTTGLDPNQIIEIRNLIKEIGKNKTVLLSTHIMQEVEAICDRAIIINKGVIVADEKVANLKTSNKSGDSLMVSFKSDLDVDAFLKNFPKDSAKQSDGGVFEIQSSNMSDTKKVVMKYAMDNDLEIDQMSEGSDSLEDVFRNLTQNK